MSFDIDQYELDYDEHPPTPTSESHGTPPYVREYGPTLPSHIVDESAPEDPTEVRTPREIGPFIPPHLLPSTSAGSNGGGSVDRRDDGLSALPSLNPTDLSAFGRSAQLEMPEDENDFISTNHGRRERFDPIGDTFPTPSPPTISATDRAAIVGGLSMPDDAPSCSHQCADDTGNGNEETDEEEGVRVIGPSIPSFLSSSEVAGSSKAVADEEDGVYGPVLPPEPSGAGPSREIDEYGDENVIGPAMPSTNVDEHDDEYYYRLVRLNEKKAVSMAPQREKWMTELPQTLRQSYGLSAKSAFSASSAISPAAADRARGEWTKAPNGSPAVVSKSATTAARAPNLSTSRVAASSSTNSAPAAPRESLMELHQRKRKGNGECGPALKIGDRVPFNRDVDMEVHGLSKVTGEEAKNRAGSLVGRFQSSSSSSSGQFL